MGWIFSQPKGQDKLHSKSALQMFLDKTHITPSPAQRPHLPCPRIPVQCAGNSATRTPVNRILAILVHPDGMASTGIARAGFGRRQSPGSRSTRAIREQVCLRRKPPGSVDLVMAAAFLGHSRLETTARYSRPNAEDLEKAAGEL